MRYMVFGPERDQYPVALLVRHLVELELKPYVADMKEEVVAYAITSPLKAKVADSAKYTEELFPVLEQLRTEYVIVTDGALFKFLTKSPRVDNVGGYVLPCKVKGYEHMHMVYVPSPKQLLYDPSLLPRIHQGIDALQAHRRGAYVDPGAFIIKHEAYPRTNEEIAYWLRKLVDTDLSCDIEAFDLKHYKAGIGTITLCWNRHEGIAFPVDYEEIPGATKAPYGRQGFNAPVRAMLKEFFLERAKRKKTKTLFHNVTYDGYVLICQLFMKDLLDTEGLLEGLEAVLAGFVDTMIVTYLATNSCAGNELGLKPASQEFTGNYAENVKDIRQVQLHDLLTYNLKDGLATWFVYGKNWPRMVKDQQLETYEGLFSQMVPDIIQMQLTGLPLDMEEVKRGKAEMERHRDDALNRLNNSPIIAELEHHLTLDYIEKMHAKWKVKRVTPDDVAHLEDCKLNLNSPNKLQKLLYEIMDLPVLALTKTKQPSTKGDVILNLRNHTDDPLKLGVLDALLDFMAVDKILTAFIPAFEEAPQGPDGWHYLFGFFNIGGTVSGRLSSSNPNLQQIPASGTKYADLIKRMFRAPKGWLFVGLDFDSLEDKISALTTKDPNKIKVYSQGFDGHCLRAFYYFRDQMPDIQETVQSINSIKDTYGDLRQDSKGPTFLLTYGGTYHGLMKNLGWSEEKAKEIESNYHSLYQVSTQWVQDKLTKAATDGYVTGAFGLRVRTPLLKQVVRGTKATPYEAEAEGRTAGNALGQSFCLLNSRAGVEFLQLVRQSQYRLSIKPCAQIHDAQYYLVRDDVDLLAWMNKHLVKCVQWQELPEIQHDEVKLGGKLALFYPTWANEIEFPNEADASTIPELVKTALEKGKKREPREPECGSPGREYEVLLLGDSD